MKEIDLKKVRSMQLRNNKLFIDYEEESTPEYKGGIEGFPKEIVDRMLDLQEEKGCERDIGVFEEYNCADFCQGGFNWDETSEKSSFWYKVIINKNFDLFFEKYPKEKPLTKEEEVLKHVKEKYEAGDFVKCLHSDDIIQINVFLDDENKFQFFDGDIWLNMGYLLIYKNGKYAEKMPLIFKTEDGVNVHNPEANVYSTPSQSNLDFQYCSTIDVSKVKDASISNEYWLFFSTKEACEEFVNNEKLKKVVRDIVKAFGISFGDIKKTKVAEVIKIINQFQKTK